ncbi:ABC transporter permease [Cytobacillus praedii]|uniref:ABC transporter permease n=1 Tax=Cytobacillus praedii TaxID=1742358 RepID=UPI002E1DFC1E|nr:ABC transporter permease [Cytobacillus praedii]
MLQIMKLEWNKNQMTRYFKAFVCCILGIYGFVTLIAIDSGDMGSFQEFMSLITVITNITFITFGSVILSRLVISEFRTKTMQVLFTYPIQRKKLLLAKLILAYTFTTGSLLIGICLMQVTTLFLQPSLGLFAGTITWQEIVTTFPKTVTNAFSMGAIALIPLFFGMRKKSTATTITSAVIIGVLVNSTVSDSGKAFSLADVVIIPLILALLGIGIAYLSFRNIDRQDVSS